jgi:hypothetical protein
MAWEVAIRKDLHRNRECRKNIIEKQKDGYLKLYKIKTKQVKTDFTIVET